MPLSWEVAVDLTQEKIGSWQTLSQAGGQGYLISQKVMCEERTRKLHIFEKEHFQQGEQPAQISQGGNFYP